MSMYTVIVKENLSSDQLVEDLGLFVGIGDVITLSDQMTFDEIAGSDDLRAKVAAGDLVINDGSTDLDTTHGVDYLELVTKHFLHTNHYTKTELQTSGQSSVHWDNITNTPTFGALHWREPALYRVVDIGGVAPGSPSVGDIYFNTGDGNYYQWDGALWNSLGTASSGDYVINLASPTENAFLYDGATFNDLGTSLDGEARVIDNDGDGKSSQYVYEVDSNEWLKIGDVDFAGHFDGGPSKHDASEIDVENAYTTIGNAAGDDLETVLGDIDNSLSTIAADAADKNTLDEA